jgi:hypothetical protein
MKLLKPCQKKEEKKKREEKKRKENENQQVRLLIKHANDQEYESCVNNRPGSGRVKTYIFGKVREKNTFELLCSPPLTPFV